MILRQFCRSPHGRAGVHVLLERNYGSSLAKLGRLAAAARETYPNLPDESIRVKQFGGDQYSGMYGIEFQVEGVTEPPDGYTIIYRLHSTR